jgi:hypothetical protein
MFRPGIGFGGGFYPRGYLGAGIGYPYGGFLGYPYFGAIGYPYYGYGGCGYCGGGYY